METRIPKIVIADSNEAYALRLESKFLRSMRTHMDLEVFTDANHLRNFFSKPVHVDVALIDQSLLDSQIENQDIVELFTLVEDEPTNTNSEKSTPIYKYTSLSHIFNQTMGGYNQLVTRGKWARASRMVTFYSPVGGSGKTTLASGVAASLQDKGFRVLYVDAEYQQELGSLFPRAHEAPAGFVTALMNSSGNSYNVVKPLIIHDVVDVVPPLANNILMYGIAFESYLKLIAEALDSGDYDFVVVDTDSVPSQEKLKLIGQSTSIVVPLVQGRIAQAKVRTFLSGLDIESRKKCHIVRRLASTGQATSAVADPDEAHVAFDERIPSLTADELAARDDIKTIALLVS